MFVESLPARGVWIEIYKMCVPGSIPGSLPARGVWIEMLITCAGMSEMPVAPRKGSVD